MNIKHSNEMCNNLLEVDYMYRLRELRKFNKLSARELGSILGYAESTILQWERGTRAPDASAL